MSYQKKISSEQFVLDCINKQFDLTYPCIYFDTFEELAAYAEEHPMWFSEHKFQTPEQYLKFKRYFEKHFYDWQPKRVSKRRMKENFTWFYVMYGFGLDFEYNLIKDER